MASTSISGADIHDYIAYFEDGGTLPSGAIADGNVTSAKIADGNVTSAKVATNGLVAANFAYEKVTGVASAGTPVSAAHTLGKVPVIVLPVSRTSSGVVSTTGTHTSAAVLGIVSNVAGGATFEVYIFG
jgi:hypothetical protein